MTKRIVVKRMKLKANVLTIILWTLMNLSLCIIHWRIQRGRPLRAPPTDQNFLNFMQFLTKCVCWRLSVEGWCPLLHGILDPPLSLFLKNSLNSVISLTEPYKAGKLEQTYHFTFKPVKGSKMFISRKQIVSKHSGELHKCNRYDYQHCYLITTCRFNIVV